LTVKIDSTKRDKLVNGRENGVASMQGSTRQAGC